MSLNIDSRDLSQLIKSGKLLSVNDVKHRFGPDVNLNAKDLDGSTLLIHAVSEQCLSLVKSLLDDPHVDPTARDVYGRTPLWVAATLTDYTIGELFKESDRRTLWEAMESRNTPIVDFLLSLPVETEDVDAERWRSLYTLGSMDIVRLTQDRNFRKSVHCIASKEIPRDIAAMSFDPLEKSIYFFIDYAAWDSGLPTWLRRASIPGTLWVTSGEQNEDIYFSAVLSFPTGQLVGIDQDCEDIRPLEQPIAVAWTMIRDPYDRFRQWKPVAYYSTLPSGELPEDGLSFFKNFISFLKPRWQGVFTDFSKHLKQRRREQLQGRGMDNQLVYSLAGDAETLANLRSTLENHFAAARSIVDLSHPYCAPFLLRDLRESIDSLEDEIRSELDRFDQTVRDLLQFEFAWVSINEAHRSTSIAASMKRLSWITFIFLPLTFASSLFGMNVNILRNNPDWRWYILFGGAFVAMTIGVWLIFKYTRLGAWVESLSPGHYKRGRLPSNSLGQSSQRTDQEA